MSAAPRPVTPQGILAATLDDLSHRLGALSEVDGALTLELRRAAELAGGLESYVDRCTTVESAALQALAERTRREDWGQGLEQEMLSGHAEGQLLKMLVHVGAARRVLDVGMFTGYSALAMAEALPPDGEVVACEVDARVAAIAQECFAASPDGRRSRCGWHPRRTPCARSAPRGRRSTWSSSTRTRVATPSTSTSSWRAGC